MNLTPEQKATVKADILANPTLAQLYADSVYTEIAGYYNALANPSWTVWKPNVSQDEIMQNGFDWTRVDNLSVGKARIWEWLFNNATRSFNPSKANVRAGIDGTWVGTAADLAVRAAVYVHCKRLATRIEKLLSSGTGSDAVPATMAVEGEIFWQDIQGL